MKRKLTEMITRSLAFVLSLGIASGAWAADYTAKWSQDFQGDDFNEGWTAKTAIDSDINALLKTLDGVETDVLYNGNNGTYLTQGSRTTANAENSKFMRVTVHGRESNLGSGSATYAFPSQYFAADALGDYQFEFDLSLVCGAPSEDKNRKSYLAIKGVSRPLAVIAIGRYSKTATLYKNDNDALVEVGTFAVNGTEKSEVVPTQRDGSKWYHVILTANKDEGVSISLRLEGSSEDALSSIKLGTYDKLSSIYINQTTDNNVYDVDWGFDDFTLKVSEDPSSAGAILNPPTILRRGFTRVSFSADETTVEGGKVESYSFAYKGGTMSDWSNAADETAVSVQGLDANGSTVSATVWAYGYTTSETTVYTSYSFDSEKYVKVYDVDYADYAARYNYAYIWNSDNDSSDSYRSLTISKNTTVKLTGMVLYQALNLTGSTNPRWRNTDKNNKVYGGLYLDYPATYQGRIMFKGVKPGSLVYVNAESPYSPDGMIQVSEGYSNAQEFVYEVIGTTDTVDATLAIKGYTKVYAIRIYEPIVATIGDTTYSTVGDVTFGEMQDVSGDAKVGFAGSAYSEKAMVWQTTENSADYGFTQTSGSILIPGGEGQTGRLEVKSGSYYTPGVLSVGAVKNGVGYLKLSGGDVEAGGEVSIGASGDYLDCENCKGTVYVTGGTLVNHGWFCVGRNQNATAYLEVDGGTIRNEAADGCNFTIGTLDAKSSKMLVKSGSVYAKNNFYVGEWNSAELTIEGGTVTVGENLVMAAFDFFRDYENDSATMYLNGGTLEAKQIQKGPGTGPCSVVFNGGTVKAAVGGSIFGSGLTYTMGKKGLTIDTNGKDVTVDVEIAKAAETSNLLSATQLLGAATVTEADYTITVSGAGSVALNAAVAEGTTLVVEGGAEVTVSAVAAANITSVVIDQGNDSKVIWPAAADAPEGWKIDETTHELVEIVYVAEVNNQKFETLDEAWTAAGKDGNAAWITLLGTLDAADKVTMTELWQKLRVDGADSADISDNIDVADGLRLEREVKEGFVEYTAYSTTVELTLPSVEWGLDFTNAVVTATVANGYTDVAYTLTYGQTTVAGSVADGTVTFNVPVAENARYANFDYSIAAKVNNASVGSASGSAIVADEKAWFSTTADATTGGLWTKEVATDNGKMTFSDGNTFEPTKASAGKIVVLDMGKVCFGDANDAEITGAQAGIRIGANDKFEVLSATGWTTTKVAADGKTEYDVVVTINYGTKKYSVKVGENTIPDIALAGDKTKVESIEFQGDGSLKSLTGEYFDGAMVKDDEGNTYDTVAEAIAALKAGTATAPLTMLHDGTAPACWTIKNGVLAQADITVESTDAVTLVAVPTDCTADGLIDLSNRSKGDMLQVNNPTGSYWNWELDENDGVGLYWKKATRVSTDTEVDDTPEASACELKAGDAVWVTRKNVAAPIILTATYATADATIEVAVTTGWKLVAPLPKAEAFNLNELKATDGEFSEKDMIVIPGAAAPINCVRKGNAWKVYTPTVEDGTNAPEGWGSIATEAKWVDAPTIPAGKGFFFVSDGEKTLEL